MSLALSRESAAFCAGTPKDKGSFFEEIWLSSDKKEWNGKEWIPTNPDADPQISGYHITQEFSSFVTPEQLEYKRKNMTPRMFTNKVLAQFFAAGGAKPVTADTLLQILYEARRNSATLFSRRRLSALTGVMRLAGFWWEGPRRTNSMS